MLGINGMVGNLSIGFSPVIAGILIDAFSWRAVFILPGIPLPAHGLRYGLGVVEGYFRGGRHLSEFAQNEAAPSEMRRAMILLAIAVVCTGIVFNAISAVLPHLLPTPRRVLGRGHDAVGACRSADLSVGAVVQLLSGWLSDRLSVKFIYIACWILQLGALAALVQVVGPAAIPLALLAVSSSVATVPPENVMYARFSPPAWRGTFYGLKFILAFSLGWPAVEIAGWVYGAQQSFDLLFMCSPGCRRCRPGRLRPAALATGHRSGAARLKGEALRQHLSGDI